MIAAAVAGTLLVSRFSGAPVEAAEAKKGEDLFVRRCGGCHELDGVRIGPPLRTVFGRDVASISTFPYSGALRGARFTWDETSLNKWLIDTESLVPGNEMDFRVVKPEERGAIIAYLKKLAGK